MSDTGPTINQAAFSAAQSSRVQRNWLLAFTAAIPAAYALFFLLTWTRVGPKDFDQFLVFHQLQYWNYALFGFAKQWTPLLCAGLSLAGEPQVPLMSLSMLLSYIAGPLLGIKLACIVYLAIGWIGAYLYAGRWRSDRLTRVLAASLFIGNGFFVYRLATGHIDFIPFFALPLALWGLHKTLVWRRSGSLWTNVLKAAACVSAYGVGIAMAVDGSPVAVIHLLFWIVLYALVLSYHARSFVPCVSLCCAITVAAILDAGYLWPMVAAQADFPRRTADVFTDPAGLLLHAILPLRGKLTHGSGKGHELTVFIGPVLALLIWRYRATLFASLPRAMLKPLLVVGSVSILLGMGSLAILHIPYWLSPFDMLRPLPGFRSIGVTARYWGFLALPLSLFGAVALRRFVSEEPAGKVTLWLSIALLLQLGSQTEAFWSQWKTARPYTSVNLQNYFHGRSESMSYVAAPARHLQGEFVKPTQGVANCYDMDDFIHAPVKLGSYMEVDEASYVTNQTVDGVVRTVFSPTQPATKIGDTLLAGNSVGVHNVFAGQPAIRSDSTEHFIDSKSKADIGDPNRITAHIGFVTWNHLRLQADYNNDAGAPRVIVLNQAWNSHWAAAGCQALRAPSNRLALRCDSEQLRQGVDLIFADEVSNVAANVSIHAWRGLLVFFAMCLCITVLRRQCSNVGSRRIMQRNG